MSLTRSYLVTVKKLNEFFSTLVNAQAPDVFTYKFLTDLGFTSTNDRLYIGVLKGLRFLDENAVPTERYFKFLDQSQSKYVLAEAIRDSYSDLFAVKINANEMTPTEVKNKLKVITEGKLSDKVLSCMASTFKALVNYAEWNNLPEKGFNSEGDKKIQGDIDFEENASNQKSVDISNVSNFGKGIAGLGLHYNIQIHLPISRDKAVYDALFQSLKKHLQ